MAGAVIEPTVHSPEFDAGILEHLLSRAADVTILVDAMTGSALRRWHDPHHSKLPVGDSEARIISWVHPDDLPGILEVLADVAREGGSRTTSVRIHPDRDGLAEQSLLVAVHDVQATIEFGLLVQAWLADFDRSGIGQADPTAAMTSLASSVPVGLQMRSANGNITFENDRFVALAAPARAEVDALVESRLTETGELVEDLEIAGRSLRLHVVPTLDDKDRLVLAVATLEDVTSLRAAEAAQAAAEDLFRAVFDGSPAATAIIDLDGRFTQVNEAMAMIVGYSVDDLVGRHPAEITHSDDLAVDEELRAEVLAGSRKGFQMEKRYLHRSGHEVWAEVTVAAVQHRGGMSHFVSTIEDITARKAMLDAGDSGDGDLAYWATHDHLTGLPNRRYLDTHLASKPASGRRSDDGLVVLFVDLDDFKPVNDQHGHQAGDEVLRTIARRLRNTSRDDELICRYGGDEFVVVTRRLRTASDVSLLVERILSAVRTPVTGIAGVPIIVGGSVGIGIAAPGDDPADVLRRADAASYRAKRAGKNQASYAEG